MNNKSFTLIELLVVIAIIGVLAAIIVTSMSGAITKSKIVRLQVFSDSIRAQLSDSLVSYWSFNEGTGTDAKDMWEGNNGTLGGDPTWKSGGECVSGKCLEFDGENDYVDCGNDTSLKSINSKTVEAWFKLTSPAAPTGGASEIVSNLHWSSNDNQEGYSLCFRYSSGGLRFMVGDGTANVKTAAVSGISIGLNVWHYVVGIHDYDANKLYLYLDGEKKAEVDITGYTAPTRNLGIGANGGYWYNNFPGHIDEVHIYSSAASITQIQSQYLAGLDKLLSNEAISKSEYNQRIKELSKEIVIE